LAPRIFYLPPKDLYYPPRKSFPWKESFENARINGHSRILLVKKRPFKIGETPGSKYDTTIPLEPSNCWPKVKPTSPGKELELIKGNPLYQGPKSSRGSPNPFKNMGAKIFPGF